MQFQGFDWLSGHGIFRLKEKRALNCLLLVLEKRNQKDIAIFQFLIVFNKTIIPHALVGYEMIIANSALHASLAICHLISNARSWNNC